MRFLRKCFRVYLDAPWLNTVLLALAAANVVLGIYPLAAAWVLLLAGVLLFFRDPERAVPGDDGVILASADGKVLSVTRGAHPDFAGPAHRVLVFMSPLDVHRNRAPVAGAVARTAHIGGRFLPAWRGEITTENERCETLFRGAGVSVLVVQLAGAFARRIVCRAVKGAHFSRGQEFGLIRFGSANELVFPAAWTVAVKVGDRVTAGVTVIARQGAAARKPALKKAAPKQAAPKKAAPKKAAPKKAGR